VLELLDGLEQTTANVTSCVLVVLIQAEDMAVGLMERIPTWQAFVAASSERADCCRSRCAPLYSSHMDFSDHVDGASCVHARVGWRLETPLPE
jgi:hypothetical protein